MDKIVMQRKAADNKYLHRDFHKTIDLGLKFIGEKYGDNGVKQYLRRFASAYYRPLADRIKANGLAALSEHITGIYELEEMPELCNVSLSEDRLDVRIDGCPGLKYFEKIGYSASEWYFEATRTVNEAIADMAGIGYSQGAYDSVSGKCEYSFFRRAL